MRAYARKSTPLRVFKPHTHKHKHFSGATFKTQKYVCAALRAVACIHICPRVSVALREKRYRSLVVDPPLLPRSNSRYLRDRLYKH
uniref:Uncharacterized protein n=1 Tax=Trichogramma kaykai TaxID=54128 RepID=A0ABD2VV84_9HYME